MNIGPITDCVDLFDTITQALDPPVARFCEAAARGVISRDDLDELLADLDVVRLLALDSALVN